MKDHIRSLSVVVMLALTAATAAAPPLSFKFSHPFVPQTRFTTTVAINNAGVIAGRYLDNFGGTHGMILAGHKLTTVDRLDCLPGTNVEFTGINNKSMAVGSCTTFSHHQIGFVWANGKFVDIKIPGALDVVATGINDQAEVVGYFLDSSATQHGFLLNGTKFKTLDVPGGDTNPIATSINNNGQVTLFAFSNGFPQFVDSFLYNGKTFKKINVPQSQQVTNSFVEGINNLGDILYTAFDSQSNEHGVLFHKAHFFIFDDPQSVNSTLATGLNDNLTMVGGDQDPNVGWEATTSP